MLCMALRDNEYPMKAMKEIWSVCDNAMVADKYASVITKIFVWGVLFGHALQAIS